MNKILIRYYKDGSIELPDGHIIRESDLLHRAAESSLRFSLETITETYNLMKEYCLETHEMVRREMNNGETEICLEFVDYELKDSKNPALNN